MISGEVLQQLWQMLQMVVVGWLMMLSAHEMQLLSKLARWRYKQKLAGDFLFCVCWALLLWLILLSVSGGLVRNYILLGWLGGAVLYQVLFRKPMEQVGVFLAKGGLWFWRRFRRLVSAPYRWCSYCCQILCRNLLPKKSVQEQESDAEEEIIKIK